MAKLGLWLLFLLALAMGVAAGFSGRRRSERIQLPRARIRAAPLERAFKAWEAGSAAGTVRALDAFEALGEAPREDVAEAGLLRALVAGRDDALAHVVERWPGTGAAGRAAWERVRRAPDAATRERRLREFEALHPDAWVLRRLEGGGG